MTMSDKTLTPMAKLIEFIDNMPINLIVAFTADKEILNKISEIKQHAISLLPEEKSGYMYGWNSAAGGDSHHDAESYFNANYTQNTEK